MKELLKAFDLDAIVGLDWETYYDDDYSLRKMAQTEYITDPRFESQLVAVQLHSWKKPRVLTTGMFRTWAKTVDWSRTGMLAHHAQFDGFIASHHFGIKPKFYFDTLSMGRSVMPLTVGGSLHRLAQALGLPGKRYGQALVDVKGRRFAEFSATDIRNLKVYAGDDIDQTWGIFHKLLKYVPHDELRLIDLTVRMYAQPLVLLDQKMLQDLADRTVERKESLMQRIGVDRAQLMSNDMFADQLRARGVEPPLKVSKTTQQPTYAFSKQDKVFKDLLDHPDEEVAALVEARLGVRSTIVETRAQRMANRAAIGAQPIYLNYWGAGTGRWSGGDKANWQNLSRGSDMRKAILPPKGHLFVIADLAQIEARINAWFAGQQDVVDAFARGDDVYCLAASNIYHRRITKDDKDERFVGKVATLALGYQAGWSRFAEMLRIGAFGPSVPISDMEAQAVHRAWRQANPFIVANWKRTDNLMKSAFLSKTMIEDGCVSYLGANGNGYMNLPGGMALRYDGVETDEDGTVSYLQKFHHNKVKAPTILRTKLYGGLAVENRTQALARRVIAEHMLSIIDALPSWRQVLTTHDEIVGVVPRRSANRALRAVKEIMSTPPEWAPGLPIAVDAHISERYDK